MIRHFTIQPVTHRHCMGRNELEVIRSMHKKHWIQKSLACLVACTAALTVMPSGIAVDGTGTSQLSAGEYSTKNGYSLKENDVLSFLGRYSTGSTSEDGGIAEIVAYNSVNQKAYMVNGKTRMLDIVSLADLKGDATDQQLSAVSIDVSTMIPDMTFGDITSVAVDEAHDRIAVAVQAEDYSAAGAILILNSDGEYIAHYAAGVQPDNIVFSANGRYVLTANEGEPRNGYDNGAVDPQGSVTIVDLSAEAPVAKTVTFENWDAKRDELVSANVLIKKGLNPSTDFEPEYIAVSSDEKTAYVSLQEANAVAVLDIESGEFLAIDSLGFQDHSQTGNEIDAVKDKTINIKNQNLMGVKMPDGIAVYEVGGKTYLLTANEGDATEWGSYCNQTTTDLEGESLEILDTSKEDGLPAVADGTYFTFGSRSFSIYEVTGTSLNLVFDSGSDFENITANAYPDYFNASNKNVKLDSRSDAKGPEPENVTICQVGQKTYAYIGLERIGGVMMYDITDPSNATFVDYINSRDFSGKIKGDVAVEGLCAIPAAESPTQYPLLLAANENSGTLAVYQQAEGYAYNITAADTANGSVQISAARASEGDTVSITPAPADGYALASISVTCGDMSVETTENSGVYTFTMPKGDVTVAAEFETAAVEFPFVDVSEGHYSYNAVLWGVTNGVVAGTDATHFTPNATCTRAQAVTMLWRAAGRPAPTSSELNFTDVPDTAYYRDAVLWAAENGIVSGTSAETFSPYQECTRAQFVCFLWRYAEKPDASVSGTSFTDVAQNSYYYKAVLWAVEQEITSGTDQGHFSPNSFCNRAQTISFLYRYFN